MNSTKVSSFQDLKLVCDDPTPFPPVIDAYRKTGDEYRTTLYVNMSILSLELAQKVREELDGLC